MLAIAKNTPNTVLVEFNTVLGRLHRVADKTAIQQVSAKFGETWKHGFTGYQTGVTKDAVESLEQRNVPLFKSVTGALKHVRYDEGTDGRQIYKKVRVSLTGDEGSVTLTLPLEGDAATRLISKLQPTTPGEIICIEMWMGFGDARPDGKRYANVGVSVKTHDDVEVKALPETAEAIRSAAERARLAAKEAGLDDKLISAAAKNSVGNVVRSVLAEIQGAYDKAPPLADDSVSASSENIGY